MYESCFAGADAMLELLIVVLLLGCAGLIAAVARQTSAARQWRDRYQVASTDARILRREIIHIQTELLFPDREVLKRDI